MARRGPKPINDGRQTKGLAVRLSQTTRTEIDDLARRRRMSSAMLIGDLIEEALLARVNAEKEQDLVDNPA